MRGNLGRLAWIAGVALGCSGPARLQPAATALQPRGMPDAVMGAHQGVEVTAEASEFPGPVRIEAVVTPLRVIVRNRSGHPLRLHYRAFRLSASNGAVIFRALAPQDVTGVVELDSPGLQPGLGYADFYMAPHYGHSFTGLEPYAGPFADDGTYYSTYRPQWEMTVVLPTDDMIERALPEATLQVGESIDGYLYFEKVRADEGSTVTLEVDLPAVDAGEVARLRLPFVMD